MAFKIIWSEIALEDYKNVIDYLISNWPFTVAVEFENIVNKKLHTLSLQPFMGVASQKNSSIRSVLLTKHNRLYYRIKNETIELLTIFDTRQNPEKKPF